MAETDPKLVVWLGSSRSDLRKLSDEVQDAIGFALYFAQMGTRHRDVRVLKGFGGAGVLEIIEDDSRATYRMVYTIKFAHAVYVLHVFQKKSKSGIKTPPRDIALIRQRLVEAATHYEENRHALESKRKESDKK